jgi:hypothetical protein
MHCGPVDRPASQPASQPERTNPSPAAPPPPPPATQSSQLSAPSTWQPDASCFSSPASHRQFADRDYTGPRRLRLDAACLTFRPSHLGTRAAWRSFAISRKALRTRRSCWRSVLDSQSPTSHSTPAFDPSFFRPPLTASHRVSTARQPHCLAGRCVPYLRYLRAHSR